MGLKDMIANKFAPISDERALEIIRSNLGLISSLTEEYIKKNGVTEDVLLNPSAREKKGKSGPNTSQRILLRVHEAFPEFMLNNEELYVSCFIFHMYANPKLDKETKKEFSNFLANGVFDRFVNKACGTLLNDAGTLLIIPRTEQQRTRKEQIINNFDEVMSEYDYVFGNKDLKERNANNTYQRKRSK